MACSLVVAAGLHTINGSAAAAERIVVPPKARVCVEVSYETDSDVPNVAANPVLQGMSWGFQSRLEAFRSNPSRSEDDGPFLATNVPCDLRGGDVIARVETHLNRTGDQYELDLTAHSSRTAYIDKLSRRHAEAWGAKLFPIAPDETTADWDHWDYFVRPALEHDGRILAERLFKSIQLLAPSGECYAEGASVRLSGKVETAPPRQSHGPPTTPVLVLDRSICFQGMSRVVAVSRIGLIAAVGASLNEIEWRAGHHAVLVGPLGEGVVTDWEPPELVFLEPAQVVGR